MFRKMKHFVDEIYYEDHFKKFSLIFILISYNFYFWPFASSHKNCALIQVNPNVPEAEFLDEIGWEFGIYSQLSTLYTETLSLKNLKIMPRNLN